MLPRGSTMTAEKYLRREQEIREAKKVFPGMEIGKAYTLWKELRLETPTFLQTGDKQVEAVRREIQQNAEKPCNQEGCPGTMKLESVCGGCVEGRKGYLSKWTCEECLHRELSKKGYLECLAELSSSSKDSSLLKS